MSSARHMLVGFGLRLAGRLAGGVLTLVATRLLAQHFGPVAYAPIALVVALVGAFGIFGAFGMPTVAARATAEAPENARATLRAALVGTMASSTIATVVLGGIGLIAYHARHGVLVPLLVCLPPVLALSAWATAGNVLTALRHNGRRALVDVSSSAYLVVAALLVVALHAGALAYVVGYGLAGIASALSMIMLTRAAGRSGGLDKLSASASSALRRSALRLGSLDVLAQVYQRLDLFVLSLLAAPRQVALWAVVTALGAFALSVPSLLTTALMPDYMRSIRAHRRRQEHQVLVAALLVGVIAAAVCTAAGTLIATLLGGGAYRAAAPAVRILGIAIALAFPARALADLAVMNHGDRRVAGSLGLVTIVNLGANLALDHALGANGAAWAMVASEAAACASYLLAFRSARRADDADAGPTSPAIA